MLDALPLDILLLVTTLLPPESLFALSGVSRSLHALFHAPPSAEGGGDWFARRLRRAHPSSAGSSLLAGRGAGLALAKAAAVGDCHMCGRPGDVGVYAASAAFAGVRGGGGGGVPPRGPTAAAAAAAAAAVGRTTTGARLASAVHPVVVAPRTGRQASPSSPSVRPATPPTPVVRPRWWTYASRTRCIQGWARPPRRRPPAPFPSEARCGPSTWGAAGGRAGSLPAGC